MDVPCKCGVGHPSVRGRTRTVTGRLVSKFAANGMDIDIHALAGMRGEGITHTVLDVREPVEIAICSLDDSISIPMQQVPRELQALPRDHPLIVICHHGTRSAMVTEYLRKSGFGNAWNLAGGIDAWAAFVEPDMPRY